MCFGSENILQASRTNPGTGASSVTITKPDGTPLDNTYFEAESETKVDEVSLPSVNSSQPLAVDKKVNLVFKTDSFAAAYKVFVDNLMPTYSYFVMFKLSGGPPTPEDYQILYLITPGRLCKATRGDSEPKAKRKDAQFTVQINEFKRGELLSVVAGLASKWYGFGHLGSI